MDLDVARATADVTANDESIGGWYVRGGGPMLFMCGSIQPFNFVNSKHLEVGWCGAMTAIDNIALLVILVCPEAKFTHTLHSLIEHNITQLFPNCCALPCAWFGQRWGIRSMDLEFKFSTAKRMRVSMMRRRRRRRIKNSLSAPICCKSPSSSSLDPRKCSKHSY